ncbi:MAG: hypothetical protein R6U44_03960 [Archaeoglobaceae archaeon]
MNVHGFLSIVVLFSLGVMSVFGVGATSTSPPQEEWNRTFGETEDEIFTSVRQTSDGGYVLSGITQSYGAGESDAWLLKTDSSGREEWNRTFGGLLEDEAQAVRQTGDGGYIIAGRTDSYATSKDIWLIRTDSLGREEWNKTIPGFQFDVLRSLLLTDDEQYIFVGEVGDQRYSDLLLVETDLSGNEVWNKTLGGTVGDYSHSVYQLPDGYIIAGHKCRSQNRCDAWLMESDLEGNETWNRTHGGKDFDAASSVDRTANGEYIIAGFTRTYGEGRNDMWLIKTNSSGGEEWNWTMGGIMDDAATSVQQTSDEGFIVAGFKTNIFEGSKDVDAVLIKLSPDLDSPENASTPNPTPTPEPEGVAGFKALLAIAGLVAGAYLIRGRYKR